MVSFHCCSIAMMRRGLLSALGSVGGVGSGAVRGRGVAGVGRCCDSSARCQD